MTELRLKESCRSCEEWKESVLKLYLNGAKHELISFSLLEQKGKTCVRGGN